MSEQHHPLLDQLPAVAGWELVEALPGGLTNTNLKVSTPQGEFVVRVSSSDAGLLAIDRDDEHRNSAVAARVGVGAPVIDYRPDLGALVLGFLSGRSLVDEDFTDPARLLRCADAVRRLHSAPAFENDFGMFDRQARYRETVREHGFSLPGEYDDYADAWHQVEAVVRGYAAREPLVPCNNDLLAGNYIDDGERVWLIDYEYSGNNDRYFELGNTATECEFTDDMVEAWVAAYFTDPTPRDLARTRLGMLRSQYGWSLWGFIQAGSSSIDYDFYGWGMHRFEKAARTFTSPEFSTLLEEAVR